jgi:hypothetical protein
VRAFNDNNFATSIRLTIEGSGVGLATPVPPAALAAVAPTQPPVVPTQPAAALSLPIPAPTLPAAPLALPVPAPTQAAPVPSQPVAPPQPPKPVIMPNVDDPNRSVPIDNNPHILAANSATWFRFDYNTVNDNGDRLTAEIHLVNGNQSGVRFEIWTPDRVNDWWDGNKPVGRGTVSMLDCDTGEPSESGGCPSPDLIWKGGFNTAATYYVRVVNDNSQPTGFTLTIQ